MLNSNQSGFSLFGDVALSHQKYHRGHGSAVFLLLTTASQKRVIFNTKLFIKSDTVPFVCATPSVGLIYQCVFSMFLSCSQLLQPKWWGSRYAGLQPAKQARSCQAGNHWLSQPTEPRDSRTARLFAPSSPDQEPRALSDFGRTSPGLLSQPKWN